jgi:DNA-directed RNA polymerase specialized sigma24 family protein
MDENSERSAFEMLLAKLDPDREKAAKEYENWREKLTKLIGLRGCPCPETIFDEAINRVAKKVYEKEQIGNVRAFVHGVAGKVYQEWCKDRKREDEAFVELAHILSVRADEGDQRRREECYSECLKALDQGQRELMLQYYQQPTPDDRKRLAGQYGITLNALQKRAFDTRTKLKNCKAECMKRTEI